MLKVLQIQMAIYKINTGYIYNIGFTFKNCWLITVSFVNCCSVNNSCMYILIYFAENIFLTHDTNNHIR